MSKTKPRSVAKVRDVKEAGPRGGAGRAAVCAAVGVVLAAGIGYRALASKLGRLPNQVSIARGTLEQLPVQIGKWKGREMPLEESIVEAADLDDYANRVYIHAAHKLPVGLYISLGARVRELVPHRPEVCYPGAGWTLRGRTSRELRLPDGAALRAQIYAFVPGGLDPRQLVVLNYYIVDGESCEDVSLLRSKAWRGQSAVRYTAQVQITCRVDPTVTVTAASEAVCAFAEESAIPIRELLARAMAPAVLTQK